MWPAARPLDLLDGLGTLTPTVVHFSGHGGRGEDRRPNGARRDVSEPTSGNHGAGVARDAERHGLFFQGPDGQPRFVSAAALKDAFAAAGSSVKLVVLNACYSELLADALLPHVGFVVAAMPSATPGRHASAKRPPSTIPSTRGEPRFTGRDAELAELQAGLETDGVVVISGAPGLGKSRLAREYAHGHAAAYPGGMFFIPFDQPPPVELRSSSATPSDPERLVSRTRINVAARCARSVAPGAPCWCTTRSPSSSASEHHSTSPSGDRCGKDS